MEMPLPGQRNRLDLSQKDSGFEGAPSPGSDTLGKEVRRHGGSNPSDIAPQNLNNTHFKSKFMQQYDQPNIPQPSAGQQGKSPNRNISNQPDPDEIFASQLRGGDKRSNGPSWNDDTAFGGFDSTQGNSRKTGVGKVKGTRPSVHRAPPTNDTDFDGDDYHTAAPPPRISPRAGIQTKLTPRTAGEVRSNLSLLKSKIRQSESAGKASGGQRLSLGGSGGFEPEDEFQNSMSARYGDQEDSSNFSRDNSKASVGMSYTSRNTSFNSFTSAYEDQAEEQSMSRNRATRPRPRGIADQNDRQEEAPVNQRQVPVQQQSRLRPPASQQKSNTGYEPSVGEGRGSTNGRAGPKFNANSNQFNNYSQNPPEEEMPPVASRNNNNNFSNYANAYPTHNGAPSEYPDESGPQVECPTCGRHFNAGPFEKHVKICEKVFIKKRKAFDSTKMRIQDNPELIKTYAKTKKEEDKAARKGAVNVDRQAAMNTNKANAMGNRGMPMEEDFIVSKPKKRMGAAAQEQPISGGAGAAPVWKQQSNAFREAMKAARAVKKAQETGAPLPPVVPSGPDPSLIPCPHCNRRFNAKAADRHIPQCQKIIAKPSTLKRGSGINAANGVGAAANVGKGRGRF